MSGKDGLGTVVCQVLSVVVVGGVQHRGELFDGECVDDDRIRFLRKMAVIVFMAEFVSIFSALLMDVIVGMLLVF